MSQYELKTSLSAVLIENNKRVVSTLPKGAILTPMDGESIPGMVDVQVNKKLYSVFEVDLKVKGKPMSAAAGA